MYKEISFLIIIFSTTLQSQIVVNGTFGSGTSSWACSPETNPESVYGGGSSNTVAEVDAAAGLCQTVSGLGIGNIYTLSYQCSRRTGGCPSPNPTNINITISGGALSKTDVRSNGAYNLTTTSFNFTALSTSHTITFSAGSGFGGSTCGMIMDNISVVLFSPLPIELLYFNIDSRDNESVFTNWETASEINNDFFTIERSSNSLDWEILGSIKGAGNSLQKTKYSFIDNSPYRGISYYRLKQTDYNGNYKYAPIQSVDMKKYHQVLISPNPSTNHILYINSNESVPYNINVYNNLGQVLYSSPNHASKDINLESIESGIYNVVINKNDKIIYRNRVVLE